MRLELGSVRRPVEVDKSTLLGKGGEKTVHRDPDHPRSKAIAVYHDPDKRRAAKINAFVSEGLSLPKEVVLPQESAFDSKGRIVGFGMRQLSRHFRNLKGIFTPSFCRDFDITTKVVADIMLKAGTQLQEFHAQNLIVSDLNDGGIMINTSNHDIAWVDVDSWSIGKYPCIVGTQLYLAPELYGTDLSSGSYFESWMDWFSFTVLLTRGLLRKHPFKAGKHAKFKNVMERARNGKTIFDSDVSYPSVGLQAEILTDELLSIITKYLKREQKGEFPLAALETYRDQLVQCSSCGTWYPGTRPHCVSCSEKTTAKVTIMHGLDVEALIETQGRILFTQLNKLGITCVAEEHGNLVLYRKDPQLHVTRHEVGIAYQRGMQIGFFNDTIAICVDSDINKDVGELYLLEVTPQGAKPITRTTTSVLSGKAPVFATSRRFLYRLAGNQLLREERFGAKDLLPRPVTQVFPGQCWFTVDPNPGPDLEVVFGLNRDVTFESWFVATSDSKGQVYKRYDVFLSPLASGESMKDLSVRFFNDRVLIMRRTLLQGAERVRVELVNANTGAVLHSEVIDPDTDQHWDSVHGKAFAGTTIMHATDDGIVAHTLQNFTGQTLPGSPSLVSNGDSLLPYGKNILAVQHSKVRLLTKS